MPLDGKRVSELSRVSKTTEDALLVVDNGGKELNSIFVRDLVVSSSSGNGFDFIGTEEEFNTALLSGKITDETVSLVTDDVYSIDEELGGIKESLNNKADIDLNNVNPTDMFKTTSVEWIMPDINRQVSTGLTGNPTSSTTTSFTCPTYGWIQMYATKNTSGNTLNFYLNNVVRASFPAFSSTFGNLMWPVSVGDVIRFSTDSTGATWSISSCYFFPCKGVSL